MPDAAGAMYGAMDVAETIRLGGSAAVKEVVLRHGKSRNVRFAIVTWNVFTNGIGPARSLPPDWRNEKTADYFRRSVAALLRT